MSTFTPGDSDFTAVLTKLKRVNPDVIYMSVYQPEGSKMIQQARKLGMKSDFLSEDAVFHPKFLEIAGPAAEGVYLTFAQAPDTPERRQFIKTYKAMWKAKAVGSYAYYAYDAGMMALAAIEKAGTPRPTRCKKPCAATPGRVSAATSSSTPTVIANWLTSSGSSRTTSLYLTGIR